LSQPYRAYAEGRWGQIHLRLAPGDGQAPPLLMLHQTPKSGWIWEPLFAALDGRTLVAPDTPGYGASDAPSSEVEIEDYAAEMLALMDRLDGHGIAPGRSFDIIGYHTGSVIAAALAAMAPDRVRRIALVSLPLYSSAERAAKRASLPDAPAIQPDGSHLGTMWRVIEGFTDPRASLDWRQRSLVENLRSGAGMYRGYGAVYRHDLEATLGRLGQEVLLLNPEDDLWEPTHRAATLLPKARMVELRGVGHGLFALETERVAALLTDFLGA